ncbi:MAG: P-II family nitrogen regulator [Oscillospiraceae bacterium]|nr:P-II family nitrogen regulator [Oscillospiraceae bacterium]
MLNLEVLLVIADREESENYVSELQSDGIHLTLAAFGQGTATKEILSMFSLEATEKAILFSVANSEKIGAAIRNLQKMFLSGAPGTGIAVSIPLNSICGESTAHYLADEKVIERKEYDMSFENDFDMIIVITNEGYSSTVMDAAKGKGYATGGTVIHARGIGMEESKKFFGITISDEKELMMIACRSGHRNRIMQSIIDEAGMNTKARSIVFSVPISSAAGLWTLQESSGSDFIGR